MQARVELPLQPWTASEPLPPDYSRMDQLKRPESERKKAPLVSVIIPAYNVAAFISETLGSVLAQTFSDYEIIVINDGSPDTEALEHALEPYRDRIVYLKQENQGAGAARNAGLRVARGEYVAFLDGDDIWLSQLLHEQVALIESEPGFDLVYADAINFGDPFSAGRSSMETNPSSGEVTFEKLLCADCNVVTSAVVARREPIMRIGLFDVTYGERTRHIAANDSSSSC